MIHERLFSISKESNCAHADFRLKPVTNQSAKEREKKINKDGRKRLVMKKGGKSQLIAGVCVERSR